MHPHSAVTDPASATASREVHASSGPGTPASTNTDGASLAALTALLDAHAKDEALRLERAHAEHRSFVEILLREHREALRAQSEAHAAQMAQLHRDVLAEHRAELARVAEAHADHLAQVLAQHRQAAPNQREHTPPDDGLRSALIEHSRCQREANQDIAEHIGALTTIVADLGQTVGMMAMAAVHPSNGALTAPAMAAADHSEPTAAPSAPVTTDSVDPRPTLILAEPGSRFVRASLEATALPGASTAASATASDRTRVLQCVGDDRKQANLGVSGEGGGPPGSSALARAPIAAREEPDGGGYQAE